MSDECEMVCQRCGKMQHAPSCCECDIEPYRESGIIWGFGTVRIILCAECRRAFTEWREAGKTQKTKEAEDE